MLRSLLVLLFAGALSTIHAAKITLVAGTGTAEKDAPAKECALKEPFGVEFLPSGEWIIVEMTKGQRVLKVDKAGVLRVIAGTGDKDYTGDGALATAASFNGIHNAAVLPTGDILLADSFNHSLRKIDAKTGIITTISGNGKKGFAGDTLQAENAQFSTLIQIALDPAAKYLYIADIGNNRIRRINLGTGFIHSVAGHGGKGVPGDGGIATLEPLVDPRSVTPDALGGFYILERNGHALRYVDPKGAIKTVVNKTGAKGLTGDGGPGLDATMNGPKYTTLDRDGSILIADAENHVIRRYDPKTGQITRLAGTGKAGAAGLDGDPLQCELRRPHGITVAPDGSLYITDSYNDRILRIER